MDTLSHALWGYAVLRWRGPRSGRWGAILGAAPDLVYGIPAFIEKFAGGGLKAMVQSFSRDPAIWRRDGPPMPQDLLDAYDRYYVWSHSLVTVAIIALIWYLVRRKPPWLLLSPFIHILMDIPTHERYLTPFLYPISKWAVEGIAWSRPPMLAINVLGLLTAYAMIYQRYRRKGRPHRDGPWPEEIEGVA